VEVLALADDLTGALETGAKFAGNGLSTLVTTERELRPAGMNDAVQVLVIDTETRHVKPDEAAAVIRSLAGAARGLALRFLYKKTDSTLRGNIGAELGALSAAWPDSPLVYVPAYPRMGRTVRRGHLFVDGVRVSETAFAGDPRNPAVESHIPTILARSGACGIEVCDGESDEDVAAAARCLMASSERLAAGPAAIAEQIARLMPLPRSRPEPWPVINTCLVINGSAYELSARQVAFAEASGWLSAAPEDVAAASASERWIILKRARDGGSVRALLAQTRFDALIVFGGDTAYEILTAIGGGPLHPLGEVVPGVPVSRAGPLYFITKAGGFGSVDVLCELRRLLEPVEKER